MNFGEPAVSGLGKAVVFEPGRFLPRRLSSQAPAGKGVVWGFRGLAWLLGFRMQDLGFRVFGLGIGVEDVKLLKPSHLRSSNPV